jgi:hypothetical protein
MMECVGRCDGRRIEGISSMQHKLIEIEHRRPLSAKRCSQSQRPSASRIAPLSNPAGRKAPRKARLWVSARISPFRDP